MIQRASGVIPTAIKIMLIRHAEKPPGNPPPHGINSKGDHDEESLTVPGWQRAGALAGFFAPSAGLFQNSEIATPATIYASQIVRGNGSERPQETVTPLIDKLGSGNVKVKFNHSKGQEKEVAQSAQARSGVVLICWEHHNISKITEHFPISKTTRPRSRASGLTIAMTWFGCSIWIPGQVVIVSLRFPSFSSQGTRRSS